ncbi:MAG: HIRAN domain-containing protein [Coriobacteriia bacterium]|nr:HIRAN domain-containing protein [Coriobacteriia bacterium]
MEAVQETTLATIAKTLGFAGDAPGAALQVPMPFSQHIVLVEDIHVAGTTHVADIDEIVSDVQVGHELVFERDPGNSYDCWAIRVFAGGRRVGYVPCDCNEILARLMDAGKRIAGQVTAKERIGAWHKIHMEVYLDD